MQELLHHTAKLNLEVGSCGGYGTEAVRIIIQYGFNNLGLERITASILEQNI